MWWNIQRRAGGFDIWTDEGPHIEAKSQHELERQLAANGVRDQWYDDILRQLALGATARVEVPRLGQFSQR